jgi:hypothetical protein
MELAWHLELRGALPRELRLLEGGNPASRRPRAARYRVGTPSRSASQRDCQRRSAAKPPGVIASAACAAM